jgi:ubiquinone/menaquinone biosynthesis C-methylase UbiE
VARKSMLARYLLWRERREPDAVLAAFRVRLFAGLAGQVVEVGCGAGVNFPYYPSSVTAVIAVEPDRDDGALAQRAAAHAPVAITVVDGTAEALPAPDASFDAAVCSWVLCSVSDPAAALRELRRVLRPRGELRFYEHVRADSQPLATIQRVVDATYWPRMLGGCRTTCDTEASIRAAGFAIEHLERFNHASSVLTLPAAPHIFGVARASTNPAGLRRSPCGDRTVS